MERLKTKTGLTADTRLPGVAAMVARTLEDSDSGRKLARRREVTRLKSSLAFRLFQEAAVVLQRAHPDVELSVTDPDKAVHVGVSGIDARLMWGFSDRGEDFRGGPRFAWSEATISYRNHPRAPHNGMVLNADRNNLISGIPVRGSGTVAITRAVEEAIVNPKQQAAGFKPGNEFRKVVAIG